MLPRVCTCSEINERCLNCGYQLQIMRYPRKYATGKEKHMRSRKFQTNRIFAEIKMRVRVSACYRFCEPVLIPVFPENSTGAVSGAPGYMHTAVSACGSAAISCRTYAVIEDAAGHASGRVYRIRNRPSET